MPHLAFFAFPDFDPVLIHLGPVAIRWYGLAYVGGILLGWLCARAFVRSERLWGGPAPMTPVDIDDFVVWATLGVLLGGRIGYVLFYGPAHFASHPAEIIQPWKGGMSFHGGFAGVVVAVVLFARSRGIPIFSLGDVICTVYPIGHFLGRVANFINGELWGRPSDMPWAMVFPAAGPIPRHPSQLYEAALEGLLLLIVLRLLIGNGALKRPGLVIGVFAIGYALMRCLCELFREPDLQLGFLWGGLTMGMLLSLPLIVVGLAFVWNAIHPPMLAGRGT
jgi:phosphatidylglycerol:prolipoprotein diacylglycerol transferase